MPTGRLFTAVILRIHRRGACGPAAAATGQRRSGLAAAALAAACAFAVPAVPLVPAAYAQVEDRAELPAARVQEIQAILRTLGYEPGPADGVPGSRTVTAIISFQRDAGLAQTGQATATVYRALVAKLEEATRPAASQRADAVETRAVQASTVETPAPQERPPAAPPPVVGTWNMSDSTGSNQTLILEAGGAVGDVPTPAFWKWRQEGDGGVVIEYDNGTGGWVRRRGRLAGPNRMEGTGRSSRGVNWSWTALRQRGTP